MINVCLVFQLLVYYVFHLLIRYNVLAWHANKRFFCLFTDNLDWWLHFTESTIASNVLSLYNRWEWALCMRRRNLILELVLRCRVRLLKLDLSCWVLLLKLDLSCVLLLELDRVEIELLLTQHLCDLLLLFNDIKSVVLLCVFQFVFNLHDLIDVLLLFSHNFILLAVVAVKSHIDWFFRLNLNRYYERSLFWVFCQVGHFHFGNHMVSNWMWFWDLSELLACLCRQKSVFWMVI